MSIPNFLLQRSTAGSGTSVLPDNTVQVSTVSKLDYSTFGQNLLLTPSVSGNWACIATSANGQYVTACINPGSIYYSSNYGQIWTASVSSGTTSAAWSSVAMSSNGQYQIAVINSGSVYYSSNYGVTWTASVTVGTTAVAWSSCAMSSSGLYATACINGASIWYSTTYGSTWITASTTGTWSSVAMSATGQYQIATINSGAIYYSSTFGSTWTASATSGAYTNVTISASGQYASASLTGGSIWYSTTYGQTWITSSSSVNTCTTLATTSTGQYQVATNGGITGLIMSYRFESGDVSSTNIFNYATGGYDAGLANNAVISTSVYKIGGGSLSLTAASSNYAQLPPFQMTSTYTGITVTCWVNFSTGNTVNARIFDMSGVLKGANGFNVSGTGTGTTYLISYNSANTLLFQAVANTTSTFTVVCNTTVSCTFGTWSHIAWVMNSTNWQIYINGSLVNTFTGGTAGYYLPPITFNNGMYSNVFIGRSSYIVDVYATGNFDDFRMYTTALTAAQISTIYNSGSGSVTYPPMQISTNYGQSWQSMYNNSSNYQAVTMSSDGAYMYGCQLGGRIYQGIMSVPPMATSQNLIVTGNTNTALLTYSDGTTKTSGSDNLDYSTFGTASSNIGRVFTNTTSGSWNNSAISANGQYQTIVIGYANGGIYISSNYGQLFSLTITTSAAWSWCCMSASGQYQYAITSTSLYTSVNYGVSWSANPFTFVGIQFMCCSASGQYVTINSSSSTNVYVSNNYGATFTSVSAGSSGNPYGLCMSASGQYQSFVLSNVGTWYSSNYGQTWAQSNALALNYYCLACSASGQFQILSDHGSDSSNNGSVYVSYNYGVTFTKLLSISSANFWSVVCSASGQYIIISTGTSASGLRSSSDYGKTWSSFGSSSYDWSRMAMSANGQYTLVGGNAYGADLLVVKQPYLNSSGSSSIGGSLSVTGNSTITGTLAVSGNITSNGTALPITNGSVWGQSSTTIYYTAGYVGIGTASPAQPFHVYGAGRIFAQCSDSSSYTQIWLSNATGGGGGLFLNGSLRSADGGTNTLTLRNDAGNLILAATGNSPYIYLNNSSGNVGIGTATPVSQLAIWNQTAVNTSPNISLVGYSITAGYGPGINFYCWISAVTPQARIEAYDDNNYGAWMTFSTKIDGGGSNALRETMRLGGVNGYVGIGTNAPAFPLQVYNATNSSIGIGNGTNAALLYLNDISAAGWYLNTAGYQLSFNSFSGGAGMNASGVPNTANTYMVINGNGTSKPGFVGIGTNSPTTKLSIYSTGSNMFSIINSTTSSNYMTFNSNGTNYGFIGCDDSTGSGLFGSGVGYGFCMGVQTNTPITFSTSNIIRATITGGGNVGIGITNPTNLLTVAQLGSAYTKPLIVVDVGNNTGTAGAPRGIGQPLIGIGNSSWTNSGGGDYYGIGFGYGGAIGGPTNYYPAEIGLYITSTAAGEKGDLVFSARNATEYTTVATERMRITSAGNVGIGTNAPATLLHVNKSSFPSILVGSTGSTGIELGYVTAATGFSPNTAAGDGILRALGGNLHLQSGGTNTQIVCNTNGNVGIGLTNPYGKLHVLLTNAPTGAAGNTWSSGWAVFGDNTGTNPPGYANGVGIAYNLTATTSLPSGGLLYSIAPNVAWNPMNYNASVHNFCINGAVTPSMIVNTNGNVGIGTNAPAYTLDVNGTLNASGNLSAGRILVGATGVAGGASIIRASPGFPLTGAATQIYVSDSANSSYMSLLLGSYYINNTTSYGSVQASLSNTGPMSLALNPAGGNVGIGTTAPTCLLHINATTDQKVIDFTPTVSGGFGIYAQVENTANRGYSLSWYARDYNNGSGITTRPVLTMGIPGTVGIGTNVMHSILHVKGTQGYNAVNGLLTLVNTNAVSTEWTCGPNGSGTFAIINGGGNQGVTMASTATAWSGYSDERLKRDISSISSGLSSILNLRPVYYNYKTDNQSEIPRSGFIAQEVDMIFPRDTHWVITENTIEDHVDDDGNKYKSLSLSMTELIPYIVKGVQEQNALITSLQSTVSQQATQLTQQADQIAQLTARLNAANL